MKVWKAVNKKLCMLVAVGFSFHKSSLVTGQVIIIIIIFLFLIHTSLQRFSCDRVSPRKKKKKTLNYQMELSCLNIHILSISVCFNIRPNVSALSWDSTPMHFCVSGKKSKRLWMFCAASRIPHFKMCCVFKFRLSFLLTPCYCTVFILRAEQNCKYMMKWTPLKVEHM